MTVQQRVGYAIADIGTDKVETFAGGRDDEAQRFAEHMIRDVPMVVYPLHYTSAWRPAEVAAAMADKMHAARQAAHNLSCDD